MKLEKVYKFYHDAGHGWLAVPIEEVRELNVKISQYSYIKGETVYLEEDCDAPLFMKAYKEKMGEELLSEYVYHDGKSIIRHYSQRIPEDILE